MLYNQIINYLNSNNIKYKIQNNHLIQYPTSSPQNEQLHFPFSKLIHTNTTTYIITPINELKKYKEYTNESIILN